MKRKNGLIKIVTLNQILMKAYKRDKITKLYDQRQIILLKVDYNSYKEKLEEEVIKVKKIQERVMQLKHRGLALKNLGLHLLNTNKGLRR